MMSFHTHMLLVSKVCMLSKSLCQRLSLNVSSLSTKFQLFPSCNFRALVYSRSIGIQGALVFKEHWYSRSIGIFKEHWYSRSIGIQGALVFKEHWYIQGALVFKEHWYSRSIGIQGALVFKENCPFRPFYFANLINFD